MPFPLNKTKIVATIGPASDSPEVLRRLMAAGMNIVRLNFSHGDFSGHADTIARVREAAAATGRRVAIMADLPGPKMRIGRFDAEPVRLTPGALFTLTTDGTAVGTAERVSVSFPELPAVGPPRRPAVPERRLHRGRSRARGGASRSSAGCSSAASCARARG